jgi:hypothetical protein
MVDDYMIGFTLQDCEEMFEVDFADILSPQVDGGNPGECLDAKAKGGSRKLRPYCKL